MSADANSLAAAAMTFPDLGALEVPLKFPAMG